MVSNNACDICQMKSNVMEMIFIIAVRRLKLMSVQSSFKHNIPKRLIIHSCNLDLGKTIGQGNISIIFVLVISIILHQR